MGNDTEQPFSFRVDSTCPGASLLDEYALGRKALFTHKDCMVAGRGDCRLSDCSRYYTYVHSQLDNELVFRQRGDRRGYGDRAAGLAVEPRSGDGYVHERRRSDLVLLFRQLADKVKSACAGRGENGDSDRGGVADKLALLYDWSCPSGHGSRAWPGE